MALNTVKSTTPGQQAIVKLMENTLINNGKADRGLVNKNELDNLFSTLSGIRTMTREYNLGHTTSTYTNWTHVEASDGYSVWKYPISSGFTNSTSDTMYNNNIKLSYQGVASSESTLLGFNKLFSSNSKRSGATYTDYTTEAASTSGTAFNLISYTAVTNETVSAVLSAAINLAYLNIIDGSLSVSLNTLSTTYDETDDFVVDYVNGTVTLPSTGDITSGAQLYVGYNAGNTIYVGNSGTFAKINVDLGTKGVGNTIAFDYSSGSSSWATFNPTKDSTNKFSNDGNITWTASDLTNWTTDAVNNSGGLYWIKIRPTQLGISFPNCYHIARADSAATKTVAMSQTDIDTTNYKWCYYNDNIYVAIPSGGTTINEGVSYVKSSSSLPKKQNYFVTNNDYIVNYVIAASDVMTINTTVVATNIDSTNKVSVDANNVFRATPSTVITAGTNLSWTGNTLNAIGGASGGSVIITAGSGISNIVEDTTPQLGGNLDYNSKGIIIAGQTVSGTNGNVVYLSGTASTWANADATTSGTCNSALGIQVSSTVVMVNGIYTTSGLTAGAIYYVSETGGAITATAPTTSTSIVRIVGYALTTTLLFVCPDPTYVEVA